MIQYLGSSALLAAVCLIFSVSVTADDVSTHPTFKYPKTAINKVTNQYGKKKVVESYTWLEALDEKPVQEWLKEQVKFSKAWTSQSLFADDLQRRVAEITQYETTSSPIYRGERIYFYWQQSPEQKGRQLVRFDNETQQAKVVLDTASLPDKRAESIRSFSISPDGNYVAYAYSLDGSDVLQWRIREVETVTDLSDRLVDVLYGNIAWHKSSVGFFYSRYAPAQSDKQKSGVYFHQLGTSVEQDNVVYQPKNKSESRWFFQPIVTDDGRYLLLNIQDGTNPNNQIWVSDLKSKDLVLQPLVSQFQAAFVFIGNEGSELYFMTDANAQNGRVVGIDLEQKDNALGKELIAEDKDAAILEARYTGRAFVVQYMNQARNQIKLFNKRGEYRREVELPGPGSIEDIQTTFGSDTFFFIYSSLAIPPTVYQHQFSKKTTTILAKPKETFREQDFIVQQRYYFSKDQTRIPITLMTHKSFRPDGSAPAILYAYGGFRIAIQPKFDPVMLAWVEQGGVYAIAHVRGGGENGQAWHEAGSGKNKQNTIDDFISAGIYLIDRSYTSKNRLVSMGRSNGGLTVARAGLARPDLFAAVIPQVGVLDLLRYDQFGIGWAWQDEYGRPSLESDVPRLLRLSPLHNIAEGRVYPAMLVTAAQNDLRVHPSHSYKFVAKMQSVQSATNPAVLHLLEGVGHIDDKKRANQASDATHGQFSFIAKVLSLDKIINVAEEDELEDDI